MGSPYRDRSADRIHIIPGDVPVIELLDSDCDGSIPESAAIGNRMLTKAQPDHKRYWREMVGTYLRNELGLSPGSPSDAIFSLRFPRSYDLYGSMRSSGACDYFLLGFHSDGNKEKFDSPANFVMHAKWLAYGRPPLICECKPCTRRPQLEISRLLTLNDAQIRRPRDETTTQRSSNTRESRRTRTAVASGSRRVRSRQMENENEETPDRVDGVDSPTAPDDAPTT